MDVLAPPRAMTWPDLVWDAAVVRGLDARARAEIEAAGRLRDLAPGETVHRAGEPADALLVVAQGLVTLHAVRRGETEPAVIRRVLPGESFGEEAMVVAFAARHMDARSEGRGLVAEIPVAVLTRALGRSAAGEHAGRIERSVRRAVTADLLRATAFGRRLPDDEIELLLDAAVHETLARGAHVYRQGDPASHAYFVASGLLQAQSEDVGRPRIEAYLSRGDLFGHEELGRREGRRTAMVAGGPAWVIALPSELFLSVARRHEGALEAAARVRSSMVPERPRGGAQTTGHVFADLYRMRVARSLLVIDQDACVRCGHCAWSCANVHDDGISRLVRRGDKVVVQREDVPPPDDPVARLVRLAAGAPLAPLLVPNSCQHCKNPSCMLDCPTGAIGRDARGEVFIREDLCTGCGSCAKGCPWDNIQIAPRAAAGPYPDVAVKCDLCSGAAAGPACVNACPVQAIARIDPSAALVELREAPRGLLTRALPAAPPASIMPRRAAAWPWVVGACLAAVGAAGAPLGPLTSGVLAGVLVMLLVLYGAVKRAPRVLARVRSGVPLARAFFVAHLALGALACGVVLAHTHGHVPSDAAGALLLALCVAVASGAALAIGYAVLPTRLTRLERGSVLPEELGARARDLDERMYAQLSGASEVVKAVYAGLLRPYRQEPLGALALVLSGRRLRDEEARLEARASSLAAGRLGEHRGRVAELVRMLVEQRAARSVRLLTVAIRAMLPLHLAATATAVVLLVVHVVTALGAR
ncbi:MAG: Formate dehydrogenase beta subunit [Labilithrix sp.]|nr:Formate dehydrogenase beta subunit [Labilithrix sp.]